MKANRREPRIRPGLLTTGVFLVAVLAVGVVVILSGRRGVGVVFFMPFVEDVSIISHKGAIFGFFCVRCHP